MKRWLFLLAALAFFSSCAWAEYPDPPSPDFAYDIAAQHALPPHRSDFPTHGVPEGFGKSLDLRLVISPAGEVVDVAVFGEEESRKFWTPEIEAVVRAWRYRPFLKNGRPAQALIEEYVEFLPPEQAPKRHVAPPALRGNSKIAIGLERTGCYGQCPSYIVRLDENGVRFTGRGYVVAAGTHTASLPRGALRALAQRFNDADFWSMQDRYALNATDGATYMLSLAIDGRQKTIVDYMGVDAGMPQAIAELEKAVDEVSQSARWIAGEAGLVDALRSENYDFHSPGARSLLVAAAQKGEAQSVRELIASGVSLDPEPRGANAQNADFPTPGLLQAAAGERETLQTMLEAGVGRNNQIDKDMALKKAAATGDLDLARMLVDYGANPRVDLSGRTTLEDNSIFTITGTGPGSLLIPAAASGNPEMIRLFLAYGAPLEGRDSRGQTALLSVGEYHGSRSLDHLAECVRVLLDAGADVNARDKDGNTLLHHSNFNVDVAKVLIEHGTDLNARNKDGETPLFTNIDSDVIQLLVDRGARLDIRNNKGQNALEASEQRSDKIVEILRKAMEKAQ